MLRLALESKFFPVKLPLLGVCILVEIVIHGGSVEIMAIRNIYRGYITVLFIHRIYNTAKSFNHRLLRLEKLCLKKIVSVA